MPAAWGTCVAMGEEPLMMFSAGWPQCDGICRPPEDGSLALANTPRKTSYGVMPGREHHGDVAVVGEPDVLTLAHGPGGPDLTRLVSFGRHDERRAAHPVLPQRGLVQQARRDHGAVHGQEVFGGEAEGAVRAGRYLRGQLDPLSTVRASLAP